MPGMTPQDWSDRELIERIPQEPDLFRELYRRYFSRVYAYIAYRVGRRQDVEDLTAETFTRVVEHIGRFEYRGEGSFAAWLFRIAHNQVSSFYRSRAHSALSLDDLPELHSSSATPEQGLLLQERFAALHTAIRALSPRRQEIVTLRFFGGLRNQDIAAVLNLDERTIASHLSRALTDLQRAFADDSYVAPEAAR